MIYFSLFAAFCIIYFKEELENYLKEFNKFIHFIHENNPLLLSYYDEECLEFYDEFYYNNEKNEEEEKEKDEKDEKEKDENREEEKKETQHNEKYKIKEELYENKYLEKFKTFTNEYLFNSNDETYEQSKIKQIIHDHYYAISYLEAKIKEMNDVVEPLEKEVEKEKEKFNKNNLGIVTADELDNLDEENNSIDDFTYGAKIWEDYEMYDNLRNKLANNKNILEKMENDLNELTIQSDFEFHEKAKELAKSSMIENKLKYFINNYIIECTPLGNVIMRYNHDKKSFEYFSDHSVPYRYLEPIGRKYVMTYRCKANFINMEEEIEKANKANETKMKNMKENGKENGNVKENANKNKNNDKTNKNLIYKPQVLTNKKFEIPPNRNESTITNPINNVEIAVKDANRYTWEGRLLDFKIIKTNKRINKDRKITFKEFINSQNQQMFNNQLKSTNV